jgi:hypothetical protein
MRDKKSISHQLILMDNSLMKRGLRIWLKFLLNLDNRPLTCLLIANPIEIIHTPSISRSNLKIDQGCLHNSKELD